MKTTYITRRETFNAAHKLWREEWSEEKNWEVFGKCSNHNWHGHNFELWVTVKGTPDPETGFIMNLKLLSQLVKIHVIEALDHKNLNLDVPFLTSVFIVFFRLPSICSSAGPQWTRVRCLSTLKKA